MARLFHLSGSVKPYFGCSATPASETPAAAGKTSASVAEENAPNDTRRLASVSRDVLRQVARARGWVIRENDAVVDVTVAIGAQRRQTVFVDFNQRDQRGQAMIVYTSRCGPTPNKNAIALLRRNARLFQFAFAVQRIDSDEFTVLRGAQQAAGANAADVAYMIESIATYADHVESRLVGSDAF